MLPIQPSNGQTVLPDALTNWRRAGRLRRYGAEGVGTFFIVLASGSTGVNPQQGLLGAALVAGLAVTAMIYALGHICGAHFNPAVTLAFTLTRHFPRREVPGYVFSQLTGASLAAGFLKLLFAGTTGLNPSVPAGSPWQALGVESVLTFLLMFVITSVATDSRAVGQSAALAIGLSVVTAILIGGPTSGASMNPARSFGPALFSGVWQDHWVYWLGPILGATLGVLGYKVLRTEGSYRHEP